jgi:hypothetical protein
MALAGGSPQPSRLYPVRIIVRKRYRPIIVLLLSGVLAGLGLSCQALASHSGATSKARVTSARSVEIGIGDEQPEMFTNPLWKQLHTKIARYIAPYDAAAGVKSLLACYHDSECQPVARWIELATAAHQQILLAFYHSQRTPTRMPSVGTYQRDVQSFVKLFPQVRQYQPWDEANRGNVKGLFSSPSADEAAKYYQALKRVCSGCQLVGLDVLDQDDPVPTLDYIAEFKREIYRLKTVMPKIWGLHDYSDVNRLEGWRTREIDQAFGGEVWLTETGGIVQLGRGFPNKNGSGLERAVKVLRYTFKLAASEKPIKRLYLYDWTGGTNSTRFDAGLMSSTDKPRAGYVVVCEQMHAAKCHVPVTNH